MGIVYLIGSGERGSIVDSTGFHILPDKAPSAKKPQVVFQASDAPNGKIDNGTSFPAGMTDSETALAPTPQF